MLLGLLLALSLNTLGYAEQASPPPKKTVQLPQCHLDRDRVALPTKSAAAFAAVCRQKRLGKWTPTIVLVSAAGEVEQIGLQSRASNFHLTAHGELAWTSKTENMATFYEMDLDTRAPRERGKLFLGPRAYVAGVQSGARCDLYTIVRNDDPSRNFYVTYSTAPGAPPTDKDKISETFTYFTHQPRGDGSFLVRDLKDPPGPAASRPKFERMDCAGERTSVDARFASRISKVDESDGLRTIVNEASSGDLLVQTGLLRGELTVFRGDDLSRLAGEEVEVSHGPSNLRSTIWQSAWSPDGTLFLVSIGYEAKVYRTADLKIVRKWPIKSPLGTEIGFMSNNSAYTLDQEGPIEIYSWN